MLLWVGDLSAQGTVRLRQWHGAEGHVQMLHSSFNSGLGPNLDVSGAVEVLVYALHQFRRLSPARAP